MDYLLLSKAKSINGGNWIVGYASKKTDWDTVGAPVRYYMIPLESSADMVEINPKTLCACSGVFAANDENGGDYLFVNDIISISFGAEKYIGHVAFENCCYGVNISKAEGGFNFVPFHSFNPGCQVKCLGNTKDDTSVSDEEPADPKKPTIICISGKARHGKDAFGDFLREELSGENRTILVTHYGDLLKYIAKSFWGWNGKKTKAGRTLLQTVGTDIVRKQYPDYWAKFVAEQLKFSYGQWQYILIPDCRFENECGEFFDKNLFNVQTVRVERPDFDNGLTEEQKNHPSETSLDNFNFNFVFECKTLEELKDKAKFLANILLK